MGSAWLAFMYPLTEQLDRALLCAEPQEYTVAESRTRHAYTNIIEKRNKNSFEKPKNRLLSHTYHTNKFSLLSDKNE